MAALTPVTSVSGISGSLQLYCDRPFSHEKNRLQTVMMTMSMAVAQSAKNLLDHHHHRRDLILRDDFLKLENCHSSVNQMTKDREFATAVAAGRIDGTNSASNRHFDFSFLVPLLPASSHVSAHEHTKHRTDRPVPAAVAEATIQLDCCCCCCGGKVRRSSHPIKRT